MLRHHRLLELYLAESLGVPWDRVHDEAEVLEHVLSEELEELIAAKLGNPTRDPHGDPIPTRDGRIDETPTASLQDARARRHRRVRARLGRRPRDAALPRRARDRARATRSRSSTSSRSTGPLFVRFGDDVHVLGGTLARGDARGGRPVSPPPPPAAGDALGPPAVPAPLERAARAAAALRTTLALLGPAFVAAIAYVDPGNFATNIAGGAKYGYLLLWVILAANLMAMLIQNLSAKVGIATGKNLPELCREHFPRPVSCGLWVQAELIAMATDLAEFIGAAIALNLLFGVPLFPAGLITARRRVRDPRAAAARLPHASSSRSAALLGVILLGFLYDTLRSAHDASGIARGLHPAASPAPTRSCSPPASSARRSCRTSSTCTRR